MKIRTFEDLLVWQKSIVHSVELYKRFQLNTDFGFKNQIQRASISISNNIAEGFERGSDRDFRRFLFIAQGSCSEVKSMIFIAVKLKYINQDEFDIIYAQLTEIGRMLFGLMKTLNSSEIRKYRSD
ncbi:four helix bundle protein [Aquirufa antheringensis]|uniref:four helix bundle protein n=1 Tax=Aquirufa antheringensis TaxID=2516559 RepID=UPI001032FFAC|nr:four helix bundle protein [Aquirufa antheringensis]MCE4217116.1 four helix bundle protein [Pseudarcicella sp. GAP-15]TBH72619.1 four helix bundle protein [Aquirufa antheringensis]